MAERLDLELLATEDFFHDDQGVDADNTDPGARCTCSVCGLTFTSVRPFDEHRTGPIDQRRCRSTDELRERGLEPNEAGDWRRPRPLDTIPGKDQQ